MLTFRNQVGAKSGHLYPFKLINSTIVLLFGSTIKRES